MNHGDPTRFFPRDVGGTGRRRKGATVGGVAGTLLLAVGLACGQAPGAGGISGGDDASPRRCAAESKGSVRAFLEAGAPASSTFDAVLTALPAARDGGRWMLALREASGATHTLTLMSPSGPPRLEADTPYRFRVDYSPGYPPASGLLIWKAGALIYAAAGDPSAEQQGLAGGVPGFTIDRLPSRCPNRGPTDCLDVLRNAPLRVTHDEATVTLLQGESADLGGYRVTCLAAEEITYSPRCADAGRVAWSYVIEKR